jgi:hypothetical protein
LAVTGRVTEFQGRNYILLEDLQEVSLKTPPVTVDTATTQTEEVELQDDETAEEPTAEEIMRRLMKRRPAKALVMPDRVRVADTKTSGDNTNQDHTSPMDSVETIRWPEETMLMDRLGRVVPGEQWWSLSFENRGTGDEERPIRLLPSRLLENAIAVSGAGKKSQVILVSGEVTEYKGANYLLLRKVLVRRDMGNFR